MRHDKTCRKHHDPFGELNKTQQTHAEKQVQMATDGAEQFFAAHLGFFAIADIRRAVIRHAELDHIVDHVWHENAHRRRYDRSVCVENNVVVLGLVICVRIRIQLNEM